MAKNFLEMSDEEIMNMVPPEPEPAQPVETKEEENNETNTSTDTVDDTPDGTGSEDELGGTPDQSNDESDGDIGEGEPDTDDGTSGSKDDRKPEDVLNAPDDQIGDAPKSAGKPEDKSKTEEKPKEKSADTTDTKKPSEEKAEVNYKAEYEKIMAPLKANGKVITLNNPDEVVKLMQMGANYTKKMQQLQPHLKLVKMLEKNGIDEDKLSLLIDLDKNDTEAVKKFLKDKNIDPLDIDTSTESNYKAGNHKVSDNEITFQNTLSDINQSEHGSALIVEVHREWDDASKDEIFKTPAILEALAEHKSSGLYDKISQEVVKQRTLGNLSNMPFIHAYHVVGKAMKESGLLDQPEAPKAEAKVEEKQVLDRQIRPKKPVTNGDRAKAASPNRGGARDTKKDFNPLAMSDDEFLKQMQDRL